MKLTPCTQAEVLAGAIALGEASDGERDAYRRHLADCGRCVDALGGERAIERTMVAIAAARESESWTPDVRAAMRERRQGNRRVWRSGLSALAGAAVVAVGAYAIFAAGVKHIGVTAQHPLVIGYDGRRLVVERRAPAPVPAHPAVTARATHRLVVVHNVVTLKRPPVPVAPVAAKHPATEPARKPAAANPAPAAVAMLGPSERDKRSVGALRTTETAPPPAHRAESIAMAPQSVVIHDVFPLGGENAIRPRFPAIAYSENAEGTTAFEVSVDERGAPVKCTVTLASGYLVLDEAVCRAAMHARYSPRTINGRAVPSLFHDAFTFRSSDDE